MAVGQSNMAGGHGGMEVLAETEVCSAALDLRLVVTLGGKGHSVAGRMRTRMSAIIYESPRYEDRYHCCWMNHSLSQ